MTPHKPAGVDVWARGPYSVRAANDNDTELLIYGDIGDDWDEESTAAASFVRQLKSITSDYITVRINSFGGAVSDALAIYNGLRRHPAAITIAIDGVAISAASLIAMAGDTVEMAENALFMVHAPSTVAIGSSKDMRDEADLLDTFSNAMSSAYINKTGMDKDQAVALLTDGNDHWYTAQDALADGFVDVVTTAQFEDVAAHADASRFAAHAPRQIAATLKPAAAAASKAAISSSNLEQPNMQPEEKAAAGGNDNVADIEAAAEKRTLEALQKRNTEIRNRLSPSLGQPGIREIYDAAMADTTLTVDQVSAQALAKMGESAEPLAGGAVRVEVGEEASDKFARGAAEAIAIRAGIGKDDGGNEFRSHTLFELARANLDMHHISARGMNRMDVVGQAFTHTSSDFGQLLADVAHKGLLQGWEAAEETFQLWTRAGTLTDFKPNKRVGLNTFSDLAEVPEGGEYTSGTIGDRGEDIQLATYGKLFSITRQMVINDDLDAFTRIPGRMGRAAKRTIGNLVYAVLTGNPAMSDGVALFHANHGNLPTASKIDTAGVEAMRVAMATQSDPDGNAAGLNIPLRYLIVPYALGGAARTVMTSEFAIDGGNSRAPNSVRGLATVIEDARLDAASSQTWYGASDPNAFDTIEVGYLDGQQSPYLEQQDGWTVDGTAMKVRIDAGVKALDFRTLAKNAGK